MSKTRELIDEFVASTTVLEPGETVVAAAKVMQTAKGRRRIGMAAGLAGALGTVVVLASDRNSDQQSLEDAMQHGFFAVATNRRLLFVSASAVRSRPDEVIGAISRADITAVESGTTRVSLLKLGTATITCSDGSSFFFEFAKPHADEGRELVEALKVS